MDFQKEMYTTRRQLCVYLWAQCSPYLSPRNQDSRLLWTEPMEIEQSPVLEVGPRESRSSLGIPGSGQRVQVLRLLQQFPLALTVVFSGYLSCCNFLWWLTITAANPEVSPSLWSSPAYYNVCFLSPLPAPFIHINLCVSLPVNTSLQTGTISNDVCINHSVTSPNTPSRGGWMAGWLGGWINGCMGWWNWSLCGVWMNLGG